MPNSVAESVGKEARADREQEVGLAEEVLGERASYSDRQRVVLRECSLRLQGGQHRHLSGLGELPQLIGGVRVEDPLAHVQERILGGQQGLDGRFDIVRVRARPPALDLRVRVFALVVLTEIARDNEQDGPRPSRAEMRERPANVVGHGQRGPLCRPTW